MKTFKVFLGAALLVAGVSAQAQEIDAISGDHGQVSGFTQFEDQQELMDFSVEAFDVQAYPGRPYPGRPGPGRPYPGRPGPGRPGPGYPPPHGPGPGYPPPPYGPPSRYVDVSCESFNYYPSFCSVWGARDVQILRQYSDGYSRCIPNQTYYVVRDGIQVSDGCRGLFRVFF